MDFVRKNSDFSSGGTECAGWLYLPEGRENPPVVVMAHGFGGERTFRLPAFAEKFTEEGMAAFLFDYRTFGDSGGEPRNLIDPYKHVEDWRAAIGHVRSLEEIDRERIALWGTSFSGGHVIQSAAEETGISAVVAQVPFVGFVDRLRAIAWMAEKRGFGNLLSLSVRGFFSAGWDMLKQNLTGSPHYVPVVGEPDEFAILNTEDSKPGILSIIPDGYDWKNETPAGIFPKLFTYMPISSADEVDCPVLILKAEDDSIIPPYTVDRAAGELQDSEVLSLQCGHFDVYTGDLFEEVVKKESEFLKEHLFRT